MLTMCYFSQVLLGFQELLALEERIGDVNTGLSEDTIMKLLKHRIFMFFMTEASTNLEPCCICQVFTVIFSVCCGRSGGK